MDCNYLPPIVWLKITDYMHGWIQTELGGSARVGDQRVISVQHLPGTREVLRMETVDDMMEPVKVDKVMSATRRNCVMAGLALDVEVIEREYGVTPETAKLFMPIECPKMRLTKNGVLRPWTPDTALGHRQASELIRVLRAAFWQAVETFNHEYIQQMGGAKYPSIDMVEAFCRETGTPELYAEAIKREWNRRVARAKQVTSAGCRR